MHVPSCTAIVLEQPGKVAVDADCSLSKSSLCTSSLRQSKHTAGSGSSARMWSYSELGMRPLPRGRRFSRCRRMPEAAAEVWLRSASVFQKARRASVYRVHASAARATPPRTLSRTREAPSETARLGQSRRLSYLTRH